MADWQEHPFGEDFEQARLILGGFPQGSVPLHVEINSDFAQTNPERYAQATKRLAELASGSAVTVIIRRGADELPPDSPESEEPKYHPLYTGYINRRAEEGSLLIIPVVTPKILDKFALWSKADVALEDAPKVWATLRRYYNQAKRANTSGVYRDNNSHLEGIGIETFVALFSTPSILDSMPGASKKTQAFLRAYYTELTTKPFSRTY